MTAAPLNNGLAKVRKLLPVKIEGRTPFGEIMLIDKDGEPFCYVPADRQDGMARAELIRDAMNEMA